MLFILLILFITQINMQDQFNTDCNARTEVFNNHGPFNDNNYYFVTDTYTLETYLRCIKVSNRDFKNRLNIIYPCDGIHCVTNTTHRNTWGCKLDNSQDCYNVEHIIPTANNIPTLRECDTNIYGNLVMAYGRWNQQLSNSYYGEKYLIYKDIYLRAYTAVYECCKNNALELDPPCIAGSISWIIMLFVSIILFVIVAAFVIYSYSKYNINKNDEYNNTLDKFIVNDSTL